ncbi:uracil-DNA glycosylase [Paenibacillus sp.]|uniref:uracil-DNA glycosylase n=1 Tax=Paenibacillus sp. TaxID=58172 RepID=UPI0028127CA4|nr:uracil-DNA glycosylase [Paenibacillus sp.]
MTESSRINCMKCRHYYVTWEPQYPRGCRAYGFKTRQMPSVTVLSSSGRPCLQYEEKSVQPPAKK